MCHEQRFDPSGLLQVWHRKYTTANLKSCPQLKSEQNSPLLFIPTPFYFIFCEPFLEKKVGLGLGLVGGNPPENGGEMRGPSLPQTPIGPGHGTWRWGGGPGTAGNGVPAPETASGDVDPSKARARPAENHGGGSGRLWFPERNGGASAVLVDAYLSKAGDVARPDVWERDVYLCGLSPAVRVRKEMTDAGTQEETVVVWSSPSYTTGPRLEMADGASELVGNGGGACHNEPRSNHS